MRDGVYISWRGTKTIMSECLLIVAVGGKNDVRLRGERLYLIARGSCR
jgi:hypothetical protein